MTESQGGWNATPPTKRSNVNWLMLLGIGAVVVAASYVFQQADKSPPPVTTGNADGGAVAPTTVQISYELTGSATGADLTYTDGSGNIQQQSGVRVPLRTTSGLSGIRFTVERGSFVSFSAQNVGKSGDLTCTISVNGTVVNTGHSSGGYTIVSCSARVP